MISKQTIEEVKRRTNLVEIVSEVVQLTPKGQSFAGLCPFHNEKTPSFTVRRSGEFFHCFGCSESGNAFSFVMKYYGMTFPEAVEFLAQRVGVEVKRENAARRRTDNTDRKKQLGTVLASAQRMFLHSRGKGESPFWKYIRERGISEDAVKEFELGFAPNEWSCLSDLLKKQSVPVELLTGAGLSKRNSRGELIDLFRGRLIFPIRSLNGSIIAFGGRILPAFVPEERAERIPKYLNSPETEIYRKTETLYGLPQATPGMRKAKQVYVVEGYLDVIGLWQAGIHESVATCGTALTIEHLRVLKRFVTSVTLLFDGDTAGQRAAARAFPLFLEAELDGRVVVLPEGEDPFSLSLSKGEKLPDYLKSLESLSLFEAALRHACSQFGKSEGETLTPAEKTKVAKQFLRTLNGIENPIFRDESMRTLSHFLSLKVETLQEMARSEKSQPAGGPAAPNPSPEGKRGPRGLPPLDQEILRRAMFHRERFLRVLLNEASICSGLQDETLSFATLLLQICDDADFSEEQKKQEISRLLRSFGAAWVAFWRESYDMGKDPRSGIAADTEDLSELAKLRGIESQIDLLVGEAAREADQGRREELHQRILDLRRLRTGLQAKSA